MAFSIKNVNLKGCLFGAPSPKDYRTVFKDNPVPDKVDLRPNCTTVEDQGTLGSCTANASVGALEYLYKCRDGKAPELSRLFVYFNSRRLRGSVNEDTGATIAEAMASVLAFGTCREETWPYDIKTYTREPGQNAYGEAMMYEAIQYSRVDGTEGSIQALAAGFPVVFGTTIPGRCFEQAAKTGVMPIPTDEEIRTNQDGGHAMLIVGYDKPARMFIVRNSWGESWGDNGYCQIPFDVITKCSRRDSFWIIGELAKPDNSYSVIRPGKETARATTPPRTVQASGLAEKAARMREDIRSSLDAEIDASSSRIDKILSGTTRDGNAGRFSTSSAPGVPSLTRLTFEVLSGDEVRHELDFADPDGDVVQIDYEWYRAGSPQGSACMRSPADIDLRDVKSSTFTLTISGFAGTASTMDRVDVVATDAAGNKSNKISQTPGSPGAAEPAPYGRESRMNVRATVRVVRR